MNRFLICFFCFSLSPNTSCLLTVFSSLYSKRLLPLSPPPLLSSHIHIVAHTLSYLYGMCLLPLTRARITLPRADRERHRGAELGEEFSLLFPPPPPPPPPSTLTSQLPKSSRWRRLRPPDTSKMIKYGGRKTRTVKGKGKEIVSGMKNLII